MQLSLDTEFQFISLCSCVLDHQPKAVLREGVIKTQSVWVLVFHRLKKAKGFPQGFNNQT